jgi:hypothetical protein
MSLRGMTILDLFRRLGTQLTSALENVWSEIGTRKLTIDRGQIDKSSASLQVSLRPRKANEHTTDSQNRSDGKRHPLPPRQSFADPQPIMGASKIAIDTD